MYRVGGNKVGQQVGVIPNIRVIHTENYFVLYELSLSVTKFTRLGGNDPWNCVITETLA